MTEWPRAGVESRVAGVFKSTPESFAVRECLGYALAGEGEHVYLFVEKRAITTRQVQVELAHQFGVADMDVSYAGMKDKHAVAQQWFSVRAPVLDPAAVGGDRWRVLQRARHSKKLRRGALAGNHFAIRLDGVRGTLPVHDAVTVPNYFGPQRFGTAGENVQRARAWIEARRPRVSRFEQSIHISSLRAFLFNEVLARRVVAGNWTESLPGDVVQDEGATGPLWGRGRSATAAQAKHFEDEALAPHGDIANGLEFVGLKQDRRPLALRPRDFSVDRDGASILLQFFLPKGGYATTVLREFGTFIDRSVDRSVDRSRDQHQARAVPGSADAGGGGGGVTDVEVQP